MVPFVMGNHARKLANLRNVNIEKPPSNRMSRIRVATWNAQSMNKKSPSICHLIISNRLDILGMTETWINSDSSANNTTIAEVLNALKNFECYQVPRVNRIGGGVGVFLRRGFTVSKTEWQSFTSMECMELTISHGNASVRLITVYRLQELLFDSS